MAITTTMSWPFFTGAAAATAEVPSLYPVGINGRGYLVDWAMRDNYMHRSIPILRQQADDSSRPAETSVNPEDSWRRGADSWHLGAGQTFTDRGDAVADRYFFSIGIDPWTKWQASLLPDTAEKLDSANSNLYLAVAGSRLYATDGNDTSFTTDITVGSPTFTPVTGTPAAVAASIASDGYQVYMAYTSSGLYYTNRTISTATAGPTGAVTLVRYVKGRIMAAATNKIYNVTALTGAMADYLTYTHANADFAWVDFAEGPGFIYAAGYSGDKSIIYRMTIRDDATALDAPIVAGELPDGEIVRSITGYLGVLLIGTDLGVRVASIAASGQLTIGPLLGTGSACRCFEPQDRFAWFGWEAPVASKTGLGRLDLSNFTTSDFAPAYATDLMAETSGQVVSVATFQDIRIFGVAAAGFYAQTAALVPTGYIDVGGITFGLGEDKTALDVLVTTTPLPPNASWSVALATDESSLVSLGTDSEDGSTGATYSALEAAGSRYAIRITLNTTGVSPTLMRWLIRVQTTVSRNENIIVPLLISARDDAGGRTRLREPAAELLWLKGLQQSRSIVLYQEGSRSVSAVMEEYTWLPKLETTDHNAMTGTFVAKFKVLADG